MKKKSSSLSAFGNVIQDLLQNFADSQFFDTRKALNEEKVTYLHLEKNLKKDIKAIRGKFNIPNLVPEDDVFTFEESEHSLEADSNWLFRSSIYIQKAFTNEVEQLINEYSLPKNFYDWLQFYILYNQKPPWKPLYNWDLLQQLGDNKDEAQRIPLTTKEKKFVRWAFRYITKSKPGRPKKEYQNAYKELIKALSESKNSNRRSRTLVQSTKTFDKGQTEKYFDPVEGKDVVEKPTYKKLAVKIDINATEEERDRLAATLRKQNERLKKRIDKTIKPQK